MAAWPSGKIHALGARDRGIESRLSQNTVLLLRMREVAGSIPGGCWHDVKMVADGSVKAGLPVECPERHGNDANMRRVHKTR